MKPLLSALFLFSMSVAASAQFLVKDESWTLDQIAEGYYDVEKAQVFHERFGITGRNGVPDSALSGQRFQELGLEAPGDVSGLQVIFCGATDEGYYAVFDEPDYNITEPRTVLVIYNAARRAVHQYLLSEALDQGRILDFRSDRGLFFLAMGNEGRRTRSGCNSYQLFCFDIGADSIVWQSDYEVCRGQFELLDRHLVAGYGGEGISDRVCLIDRLTGATLQRAPLPSQPVYIEATASQDTVYVSDYTGAVHRFLICDRCVRVMGRSVRLRRGPSTDDAVFTDARGKTIYPRQGDMLAYLGQAGDFYKVRFRQQELYISRRYSELLEVAP